MCAKMNHEHASSAHLHTRHSIVSCNNSDVCLLLRYLSQTIYHIIFVARTHCAIVHIAVCNLND